MRTKPHSRPAKRGSGAAGTGGGCAVSSTLSSPFSAGGVPSHSAAPSSASPATPDARFAMSVTRVAPYRIEQQLLCALEARRDLQRRQGFLLRRGAVAGQQVALAEVAVRRRLVGGPRLQRGAELARRDRGV